MWKGITWICCRKQKGAEEKACDCVSSLLLFYRLFFWEGRILSLLSSKTKWEITLATHANSQCHFTWHTERISPTLKQCQSLWINMGRSGCGTWDVMVTWVASSGGWFLLCQPAFFDITQYVISASNLCFIFSFTNVSCIACIVGRVSVCSDVWDRIFVNYSHTSCSNNNNGMTKEKRKVPHFPSFSACRGYCDRVYIYMLHISARKGCSI